MWLHAICAYSCICMCTCGMEMYMNAWVHLPVEFSRRQLWVSFLRCLHLSLCLRQVLSLAWNSPKKLGYLDSELQGSACLCFQSIGVTSLCHSAWFFWLFLFYKDSAVSNLVFLRWKQLYPLPYLHSLSFLVYIHNTNETLVKAHHLLCSESLLLPIPSSLLASLVLPK